MLESYSKVGNSNASTPMMEIKELPLLSLFEQLQKAGLPLGVGEYELLIKSLEGGFGVSNRESLCRLCCLLWARSPRDQEIIERCFQERREAESEPSEEPEPPLYPQSFPYRRLGAIALFLCFGLTADQQPQKVVKGPIITTNPTPTSPSTNLPTSAPIRQVSDTTVTVWREYHPQMITSGVIMGLGLLLFKLGGINFRRPNQSKKDSLDIAPLPINLETDEIEQALDRGFLIKNEYHPLTERQMKQKWRQLRRLVRQGHPTELDLRATLEQISRQGFLLNPVLLPRRSNQTQLLLLLDWDGSMIPFHRLAQGLAETAISGGKFKSVQTYYFNNCPMGYIYGDPYHQQVTAIADFLPKLNSQETVALIFSDAGALRGGFNRRRVAATKYFLGQLQEKVRRLVWLNPLLQERWEGTTAEAIAQVLPMHPASYQGFQMAIAVLRGYSDL